MSTPLEDWGGPDDFQLIDKELALLSKWKNPRDILFDFNGFLFINELSQEKFDLIINAVSKNPKHTYILPSKSGNEFEAKYRNINLNTWFTNNIWLGIVLAEDEDKYLIDSLRKAKAKKKFIVILLDKEDNDFSDVVDINESDLTGIDWMLILTNKKEK